MCTSTPWRERAWRAYGVRLYGVRRVRESTTVDVLISGASIAGPALAYWLRRYGLNPTVVERATAPRPGGHAVDLRGVAREVVERMGIMAEVRRSTVDERGVHFVDER